MPSEGAWRLARRLVGVAAKVIAIIVAIVLLSAATYEQIGAWRDGRVLKQILARFKACLIANDLRSRVRSFLVFPPSWAGLE